MVYSMNPNGRCINIVLFFNEFHYMSYCLHQFIKTLASKPFESSKKHSTPFGVLCFFVFDYTQTDPLISEGTEHDRVRWTKKGERGCAAVDR